MTLPFTIEQFFEVFRQYNTAVGVVCLILFAAALAAVVLLFVPTRASSVAISAILAGLWSWVGLVYHLHFFARINPLAYAFAALSVAGALVFLWQGVIHRRLEFAWSITPRKGLGLSFIVFALFVYPAWSWLEGHRYPAFPTFGLPCPTSLFTIGMLAFLTLPHPRAPLVVPVVWCFVGAQAAFLLGVRADLGLGGAALFGLVLIIKSKSRAS